MRAGAARAARAQEVASPGFRAGPRGRGQYGNAVQSECNTRGFGGAGVAPPRSPGLRPTATFDGEMRRVRASLGQSGAIGPGHGKAAAAPDVWKAWEKVASQKSRKRKFASASQSEAGERSACARPRSHSGQSRTRTGRPPGLLGPYGGEGGPLGVSANQTARRGAGARRPTRAARGRCGRVPGPGFIKARSGSTRALVALAVPAALT